MKTLNVLSIDWDYFMNCSAKFRADHFPDGGNENIGSALANLIWSQRYAFCPDIEKVKVRTKDLDILRNYVESNDFIYMFACMDSHKHLGEFLLDEGMRSKYDEIKITNIDHHSDMYNMGEGINCGNWLNRVIDAYPKCEVKWIANEDSDMTLLDKYSDNVAVTDMKNGLSGDYDIIYLCRSSVWSAPHLDKQFSALSRFLRKRCIHVLWQEDLPGRFDNEFKQDIKTQIQFKEDLIHEGDKQF